MPIGASELGAVALQASCLVTCLAVLLSARRLRRQEEAILSALEAMQASEQRTRVAEGSVREGFAEVSRLRSSLEAVTAAQASLQRDRDRDRQAVVEALREFN